MCLERLGREEGRTLLDRGGKVINVWLQAQCVRQGLDSET